MWCSLLSWSRSLICALGIRAPSQVSDRVSHPGELAGFRFHSVRWGYGQSEARLVCAGVLGSCPGLQDLDDVIKPNPTLFELLGIRLHQRTVDDHIDRQ
jgi:hypothetical protein